MTMRDTAEQFSGPSLGMDVGVRRTLDILCAGMAALLLAPVMLIVVIAIWIESGGPILFSQLRLDSMDDRSACTNFVSSHRTATLTDVR